MPKGKRAILEEGQPTLSLLWKVRSDFAKESLCFPELNSGAPEWVTTYKWIACWVWLYDWPS